LVCAKKPPEFLAGIAAPDRAFFCGFFAVAGFIVPASFEAQYAPVGCFS
jgi:hypothetical protein